MLIFDIQVINLQYLVQAWNCVLFHVSEGPEKTQRTMVIDSRPTLYRVGTANVHPCTFRKFLRFSETRMKHDASHNIFLSK